MHENIYYNKYKAITLWGYKNIIEKYLLLTQNEKETIVSVY